MNASKQLLKQVNEITYKYSKWLYPIELQAMYNELEDMGVTTGLIYNDNKVCEWYYNGIEILNSLYCYSVYKDNDINNYKNEYIIYFS